MLEEYNCVISTSKPVSKLRYRARYPKLIIYLHFTKTLKRDNIYHLCLWIIEEHSCLILTSLHVSKLRYDAHAQK